MEFNVPLTPAEKQQAYRQRIKRAKTVTEPLPIDGNESVTREEKSRESLDSLLASPPSPPGGEFLLPSAWNTPQVQESLRLWFKHVEGSPKGHPIPDKHLAANQAVQFFPNTEELCRSIARGIANGYVTLQNYEAKDAHKQKSAAERKQRQKTTFDDGLPILGKAKS